MVYLGTIISCGDINNDFIKQKQNPPLQDEMSENEHIDDKDSQNEYSEPSEESMNEEDGSKYKTKQDKLRSPLISQWISKKL